MIVLLKRTLIADDGAYGMLVINNSPLCISLERTFGEHNKIVIPVGDHPMHRDWYHGGNYEVFEIDVQGSGIEEGRKHTRILIHAANVEDELRGCVAPGSSFIWMKGKRSIGSSGKALKVFMKAMKGVDKGILRVVNP